MPIKRSRSNFQTKNTNENNQNRIKKKQDNGKRISYTQMPKKPNYINENEIEQLFNKLKLSENRIKNKYEKSRNFNQMPARSTKKQIQPMRSIKLNHLQHILKEHSGINIEQSLKLAALVNLIYNNNTNEDLILKLFNTLELSESNLRRLHHDANSRTKNNNINKAKLIMNITEPVYFPH